jgi:hypothetical protein
MTRPLPGPVPSRYRIRVAGHLDHHWSAWFGDLALTREGDGTTCIVGLVSDQAQLHGLLTKVRDLGVTLISVECLAPSAGEGSRPGQPDVPGRG